MDIFNEKDSSCSRATKKGRQETVLAEDANFHNLRQKEGVSILPVLLNSKEGLKRENG